MYSKKTKISIWILLAISINVLNSLFVIFGSTQRVDVAEAIANDIEVAVPLPNINRVEFGIMNASPSWFVYNKFNLTRYSSFDDGSFAYMEYDETRIYEFNDSIVTDSNIKLFGATNDRLVMENIYEMDVLCGSTDFSYLLLDSKTEPANCCALSRSACDLLGVEYNTAIDKTIVLNNGDLSLTVNSIVDDKCLLSNYKDCPFVLSNYLNFSPKFAGERFVSKIKKGRYASNITIVGALLNYFYFNVKASGGSIAIETPNNEWITNEIESYGMHYVKNSQFGILIILFLGLSMIFGFTQSYFLSRNPIFIDRFKDIYLYFFTLLLFLTFSTAFSLAVNHVVINGLSINTFSSSCIIGELTIMLGWLAGVGIRTLLFKNIRFTSSGLGTGECFELNI